MYHPTSNTGLKIMSRKVTTKELNHYGLAAVIMTSLDPLIKALNSQVDEMGGEAANLDTGNDLPSTKDMGIRIVLGNIIQNLHNQCYGAINSKTGVKMPNAKEQFDSSEQRLAAMADRLTNGTTTEADLVTLHWFNINEARFNFLNDMISAYAEVYRKVTNEDWKPFERKDTPPVELTEEMKAAAMASLKRVQERSARV